MKEPASRREQLLIEALEEIAQGEEFAYSRQKTAWMAIDIAKDALQRIQEDPDIGLTITPKQATTLLNFLQLQGLFLTLKPEITEIMNQLPHAERSPSNVAEDPILRLVCGWCSRVMREGGEPTSRGICQPCARDMQDKVRQGLTDHNAEELVFHHQDGRMAKIKRRDFGPSRPMPKDG